MNKIKQKWIKVLHYCWNNLNLSIKNTVSVIYCCIEISLYYTCVKLPELVEFELTWFFQVVISISEWNSMCQIQASFRRSILVIISTCRFVGTSCRGVYSYQQVQLASSPAILCNVCSSPFKFVFAYNKN